MRTKKETQDVNLTRALYRAARISNNLSAVASGKPSRMARRAKNITVGRAAPRRSVATTLEVKGRRL